MLRGVAVATYEKGCRQLFREVNFSPLYFESRSNEQCQFVDFRRKSTSSWQSPHMKRDAASCFEK